jgi:hypothetical protein
MSSSLLFVALPGVIGSCPGPNGDAFCQISSGPSSYCAPGVWKCLGTTKNCGCDFSVRTSTLMPTTRASTSPRTTVPRSTTTRSPTSSTTATAVTSSIATTRTPTSPEPAYDGAPLFLWAEWPDIHGVDASRAYYSKMISVLNAGSVEFNRLILRITNPTLDATTGLWSISPNSILFESLISKIPSSVTELMVYPYLLTSSDQSAWMTSMNTPTPLEGVFKYASEWNSLLASRGLAIRFSGVVVDGEEKVGFQAQLPSVAAYKRTYGIGVFGYATGYSSTGDWNKYGPFVDQFYLEMYDFYVYDSPTLQLVQNTDVTSSAAFVTELNKLVLPQSLLKNYNNPKFQFMWSVQNSVSTNCLYPLNGVCGSKEDFGTQSIEYFLAFLAELKSMYPSTFGAKPNGIFQFSFIPNSWFP